MNENEPGDTEPRRANQQWRIRKKFLQCGETFAEIENFVGLGYRWANAIGAG